MDFLKDLLQIQHELILHQVSDKILNDDFEKEQFMNKYKKRNYSLVKVCNCITIDNRVKDNRVKDNRVKIEDLLSNLTL